MVQGYLGNHKAKTYVELVEALVKVIHITVANFKKLVTCKHFCSF